MQKHFTPAGLVALGGWAIAGNLGLAPGSTQMYQVFSLLSVLFFVAWLSRFSFRNNFDVERKLPRWVSAGETVHYPVRVRNLSKSFVSGLTLLEDQSHLLPEKDLDLKKNFREKTGRPKKKISGLEKWFQKLRQGRRVLVSESHVPSLQSGEECEPRMEIKAIKRGYHRFKKLYLTRRDPFGLLRFLQPFQQEQSLLILPKMYRIPPIQLPGKRHHQPHGVSLASHVGESEEFVGLRDYRSGDPLRDIHWRSWAKSGRPVVKQYQDEFFSRQALVLDTFIEDEESLVFEDAVSIAASFVNNIDLQDSLLDLMFIGTEAYCFTSGRSLGSAERMLEILASVESCSTQPFSFLTQQVQERTGMMSGCILILLEWNEERQDLVRFLRSKYIPVTVVVVQEQESEHSLAPGPMQDLPDRFHVATVGAIQEGLNRL